MHERDSLLNEISEYVSASSSTLGGGDSRGAPYDDSGSG